MAVALPTDRTPRRSRRGVLVLLGLLSPAALFASAATATPPAPAARFIDSLGQRVLAVLNDRRLDRTARLDRLAAILDEATDLGLVARLVLGRYWREASEAQRREFVTLFRQLLLKTMADRLDTYGGETYEILSAQAVDDRDTMVATRIRRPGAEPIAVDWRVRDQGGRLVLIDIVAEGVSMVVTHRSEAAEIAGRSGIDGLLAEMRRRLESAP